MEETITPGLGRTKRNPLEPECVQFFEQIPVGRSTVLINISGNLGPQLVPEYPGEVSLLPRRGRILGETFRLSSPSWATLLVVGSD